MTEPVRLAKYLAAMVPCSRREAELYIAGGWVTVDGQVVEEPQFMVAGQKVELHPDATLVAVAPVTFLFHQPPGADMHADSIRQLLCDGTRSATDHSGMRLLRLHLLRLTQCLPLEPQASGLAVLTQDYRVARKLTDDAALIEQEYIAEVSGGMIADGLKLLNHGLSFNGKALPPIKASWQNETHLRFALKGAQPGQIVHMCNSVGLQVLSLKRLRIGRMPLAKLPSGQWRFLMPYEKF